MRLFRFALLPALFVIGCSATGENSSSTSDALSNDGPGFDDGKGTTQSVAYGPCAASRDAILSSVSSARSAAIARGFEWLDADVQFSKSATHGGYRTDCSGFVSMCLQLGAPGQSTRTLGTDGTGTYKLASYDELVPADALVDFGHHSFIFLGWNDARREGMCVLEQSSTKNDMQFRVRMTDSLKSAGFFPVRADELANDTMVKDTSSCDSKSEEDVCDEAKAAGVECGSVVDNCGRAIDCAKVTTFGCSSSNETCTDKKCTSTCTPKPLEDLCATAKLKDGVECGAIDDGCGGTVSCDNVVGFGCPSGQTCGEIDPNKCPGGDAQADDLEGDSGDESGEDEVQTTSTKKPKSSSSSADVNAAACSSAPVGSTKAGFAAPAMALLFVLGLRRRAAKRAAR